MENRDYENQQANETESGVARFGRKLVDLAETWDQKANEDVDYATVWKTLGTEVLVGATIIATVGHNISVGPENWDVFDKLVGLMEKSGHFNDSNSISVIDPNDTVNTRNLGELAKALVKGIEIGKLPIGEAGNGNVQTYYFLNQEQTGAVVGQLEELQKLDNIKDHITSLFPFTAVAEAAMVAISQKSRQTMKLSTSVLPLAAKALNSIGNSLI